MSIRKPERGACPTAGRAHRPPGRSPGGHAHFSWPRVNTVALCPCAHPSEGHARRQEERTAITGSTSPTLRSRPSARGVPGLLRPGSRLRSFPVARRQVLSGPCEARNPGGCQGSPQSNWEGASRRLSAGRLRRCEGESGNSSGRTCPAVAARNAHIGTMPTRPPQRGACPVEVCASRGACPVAVCASRGGVGVRCLSSGPVPGPRRAIKL